jgi:hypothetical protein
VIMGPAGSNQGGLSAILDVRVASSNFRDQFSPLITVVVSFAVEHGATSSTDYSEEEEREWSQVPR